MWDPHPRPLSLKGEGWLRFELRGTDRERSSRGFLFLGGRGNVLMRTRTFIRLSMRRLVGAAALAVALGTGLAAAADKPRHVVKDPYYGDSLFYFFQDRYFTSVTDLMVAQHFNRLKHHVDEAEVLRGGLYLSYGLHREAGEIFAQLIERGTTPEIRDRAWFYLAKIRYQRGLFAEAEEAIGRVERGLPPDLDEERWMLMAQLLMARGDY